MKVLAQKHVEKNPKRDGKLALKLLQNLVENWPKQFPFIELQKLFVGVKS